MPLRFLSKAIQGKRVLADALTEAAAIFESYVWNTANFTDASVTAVKLGSDVPFTESYTSAAQTITSAGALTLTHLLKDESGNDVSPELIQLRLICKTAESNYSVDDVIIINPAGNDPGGTASRGQAIKIDSTTIYVRFGSDANVYAHFDDTSGSTTALTNANWKLIVKAWA